MANDPMRYVDPHDFLEGHLGADDPLGFVEEKIGPVSENLGMAIAVLHHHRAEEEAYSLKNRDFYHNMPFEEADVILREMGFTLLSTLGLLPSYKGGRTSMEYFYWHYDAGLLARIQEYDGTASGEIQGEIRSDDCHFLPSGCSRSPNTFAVGDAYFAFAYHLKPGVRKALELLAPHTLPRFRLRQCRGIHYPTALLDFIRDPRFTEWQEETVPLCHVGTDHQQPANLVALLQAEYYDLLPSEDGFVVTQSRQKLKRYWWTDTTYPGIIRSWVGPLAQAQQAREETQQLLKAIASLQPTMLERYPSEYQRTQKFCFTPQTGPFERRSCQVQFKDSRIVVMDYCRKNVLFELP